jgi:hypothetical protein
LVVSVPSDHGAPRLVAFFRHAKAPLKLKAGKGLFQISPNFAPRSQVSSPFGDLFKLKTLAWIAATPSAPPTSRFHHRFKLAHLFATQRQTPANNSVSLRTRSSQTLAGAKES